MRSKKPPEPDVPFFLSPRAGLAWGLSVPLPALPAHPGSYRLLLALPEAVEVQIGRLGRFRFPAGRYVYCGSAHGPGGVRARLLHHARPAPHPHWHLDFLRPYAQILGGWVVVEQGESPPLECRWSQELRGEVPVPGFGASDCRWGCAAHLMWVENSTSTACRGNMTSNCFWVTKVFYSKSSGKSSP